MGSAGSAPEDDEWLKAAVEAGQLERSDLSQLLRFLRRLDKGRSGKVRVTALLNAMDEARGGLIDSLLELLELHSDDGELITLGQAALLLISYGFWEEDTILKFAFYIFDRDRNGWLKQPDLKQLVEMLWQVEPGGTLQGNPRTAWQNLPMDVDGRVDFEEFVYFHRQFPSLLFPAFRLQHHIWSHVFGRDWWEKRRWERVDRQQYAERKRVRKLRREAKKRREVTLRRKRQELGLGSFSVYMVTSCCGTIDDVPITASHSTEEEEEKERLERERVDLRRKALAIATEAAAMQMKNPTTLEWEEYCRRMESGRVPGAAPSQGNPVPLSAASAAPAAPVGPLSVASAATATAPSAAADSDEDKAPPPPIVRPRDTVLPATTRAREDRQASRAKRRSARVAPA